MRIGVLTFHRAYNCGSALQAWALKRVLEKIGNETSVVEGNQVGLVPRFPKFEYPNRGFRRVRAWFNFLRWQISSIGPVDYRRHKFRQFCADHIRPVPCRTDEMPVRFDKVVIGSDQIWNPTLMSKEDRALFLGETIPGGIPKIAYAASLGDQPLAEEDASRLARAARTFDAISVRERIAGDGLVDRQGRSPELVLDPTLLLDTADYLEIAWPRRMRRGRYILLYAVHLSPFVYACAEKASRELGLPCVILGMYQQGINWHHRNIVSAFGPAEFLAWYRDAEAVIASSFHATAFSIIFGKPFVSLRDQADGVASRSTTLLAQLGEPERLITPSSPSDWVVRFLTQAGRGWSGTLAPRREDSLAFLKRACSAKASQSQSHGG